MTKYSEDFEKPATYFDEYLGKLVRKPEACEHLEIDDHMICMECGEDLTADIIGSQIDAEMNRMKDGG